MDPAGPRPFAAQSLSAPILSLLLLDVLATWGAPHTEEQCLSAALRRSDADDKVQTLQPWQRL
jgi:hypothetical protein